MTEPMQPPAGGSVEAIRWFLNQVNPKDTASIELLRTAFRQLDSLEEAITGDEIVQALMEGLGYGEDTLALPITEVGCDNNQLLGVMHGSTLATIVQEAIDAARTSVPTGETTDE